jgi:hypothetical protein
VEVLAREVARRRPPPVLRFGLDAVAPADRHVCLAPAVGGEGALAGTCPAGLLLSGPRFYAPHGSRLRATLAAEATAAGRLNLLAGSESEGLMLLEGEAASLAAGERTTVRLAGPIEAALNEVQLALAWRPEAAEGGVRVDDLEVEVELP